MKIWRRFFFKPLFFNFIFSLSSVFFIYIIIDLSIHGMDFLLEGNQLWQLTIYYFLHLSIYWNLFSAFSFLLATLKVLSDTNNHLEWSAFQTGGLSSKRLLSPFFIFAAILSLASYSNEEWIKPNAGKIADFSLKTNRHATNLYTLPLQDGSELVYKTRDGNLLKDLFWVKNSHEIWHLESLCIDQMIGKDIDILQIDNGVHLKDSFTELQDLDIPMPQGWEKQEDLSAEWHPISSLIQDYFTNSSEKQTYLHRKLAEPFLPFLCLLAISPFLLSFQRRPRLFLIASIALLSFFAQLTFFEGFQILGENKVLAPSIAIWTPLLLAAFVFINRFRKI